MSNTNYISAKKAMRLTNGYAHCMNFTYWDIVNNDGDSQNRLQPGRWVIIQNYYMPTVFLKVEKDMTLTEYHVKEDKT